MPGCCMYLHRRGTRQGRLTSGTAKTTVGRDEFLPLWRTGPERADRPSSIGVPTSAQDQLTSVLNLRDLWLLTFVPQIQILG